VLLTATADSGEKVAKNETAFPLWSAMDSLWDRKAAFLLSSDGR